MTLVSIVKLIKHMIIDNQELKITSKLVSHWY